MEFLTRFPNQIKDIWPGLSKGQKILLIGVLCTISLSLLLLMIVVSTIRIDYIPSYIKGLPNEGRVIEITISFEEDNRRLLKIIDLNSLLPSPIGIIGEVEEDCISEIGRGFIKFFQLFKEVRR